MNPYRDLIRLCLAKKNQIELQSALDCNQIYLRYRQK